MKDYFPWLKKNSPQGLFLLTIILKHFNQVVTNDFSVSAFYMVSFDKMYKFAVFKQSHGRGRRRVGEYILSDLVHRIGVIAGKNRGQHIRFTVGLFQCPPYAWPCSARGTGKDGSCHNKGGSRMILQMIVYIFL